MNTRLNCLKLLALSLLLFTPLAAHAAESYDNCTGTIASIPATITSQGTWCLKGDVTTSLTNVTAIDIKVNNVTIDCNDFKIGGLAAGSFTQSIGIRAESVLNTTVRNCNIRGFYQGVSLFAGGGHVVEDNRFDGNTYIGIAVEGDGSIVQRNRVFDTGGSEVSGTAIGIYSHHSSVNILDNTVSGVTPSADFNGLGIYTL